MSIEHFIGTINLPKMYPVTCNFPDEHIEDVAAATRKTLQESGIADKIKPNARIAIGVGSRGINSLPQMVRAVVDWMKECGAAPFIVPCMGSHGGATGEGQAKVLKGLGITEESMDVPIIADMSVVQVGHIAEFDLPVYMDAQAAKADAVFVINRIKLHTSFEGPHESGLVKMLTIGLGKQKGAESCHNLGYAHFHTLMPQMASAIIAGGNILGGLATVENAHDKPCILEAVSAERFLERDAALLKKSRDLMPSLPVKKSDVLIIDRMGKNISGTGMDPNITGRFPSPYKTGNIQINRVAVLTLTPESKGNALGMGCADVITEAIRQETNYADMYTNVITSTLFKGAFTPMVLPTDKQVVDVCVKTCNAGARPIRLIRIQDTLQLNRILVSESLLDELPPHCTIASDAIPWNFDAEGNLNDKESWTAF